MIHRRLFLGGLLSAAAAPAIVKASSLMKVVPAAVVEPALWIPRGGGHSSRHTYNSVWSDLQGKVCIAPSPPVDSLLLFESIFTTYGMPKAELMRVALP